MIDMLRIKNIFDSIGGLQSPTSPDAGVAPMIPNDMGGNEDDDIISQIAEIFKPREEQFNKLTSLTPPRREDYKPSKMKQIAAAIAGFGTGTGAASFYGGVPVGFRGDVAAGKQLQESLLDKNYNKAVDDYKLKLEPLEKTAQLEGSRNTNDRLIKSQLLTADKNAKTAVRVDDRNKQLAKEGDARIEKLQKDSDIAAQRLAIYKDVAKGGTLTTDKDGETYMVYKDGTKKKIGIDVLSPEEKLEIQHKNALERIEKTGDKTQETEGVRQTNRLSLEGTKQTNRLEIKKTPTAAQSAKGETPAAEAKRLSNKARDIINNNKELTPYFVIGGNKLPTGQLKPPNSYFGQAEKMKNYERAKSLLLSDDTNSAVKTPPPISERVVGKTKFTLPNGKIGTWNGTGWAVE